MLGLTHGFEAEPLGTCGGWVGYRTHHVGGVAVSQLRDRDDPVSVGCSQCVVGARNAKRRKLWCVRRRVPEHGSRRAKQRELRFGDLWRRRGSIEAAADPLDRVEHLSEWRVIIDR